MRIITRPLRAIFRKTVRLLPTGLQQQLADAFLWERYRIQETLRQREMRAKGNGDLQHLRGFDSSELTRSIHEVQRPWSELSVPDCQTPGMLTDEEKQYYGYITKFYTGQGAAVEIGTWLGSSTAYLVKSLRNNPNFRGLLHCFDDYTWRASSMNKWLAKTDYQAPENHGSFLPLFEQCSRAAGISDSVVATAVKLSEFEGNSHLPQFEWRGGPIELCVVDCGRTIDVNEAWYRGVKDSLIPDRTLIVMQDWQCYKAVPELFWENTKLFTDRRLGSFDLVHELPQGMTATFLYRGE